MWTTEQLEALQREYGRIGSKPGERWPAPDSRFTPEQHLAMLLQVPDGGGVAGYFALLRGAIGKA